MRDVWRPLDEYGFLARRSLPSGKILGLVPLTFGRLRLTIGPDLTYIDHGY